MLVVSQNVGSLRNEEETDIQTDRHTYIAYICTYIKGGNSTTKICLKLKCFGAMIAEWIHRAKMD